MMNNKMRQIVKHAYTTTIVYEDLAKNKGLNVENILESNIVDIPILEKTHLMRRENSSLSSEYVVKAYREELLNIRSSGSTGRYLNIYWDREDFVQSLLPLWLYRRKYYGIDAGDKMCFFYTARAVGSTEQRTILQKNQLGFSKNNLDMNEFARIYEEMREFKPKWLNIQPSIAALLCQSIRKLTLTGLDSIQYVEFTGEMLSESVRKEVESIFNCKTANQYGANEVNSMAYECPYGNMHILQSNVNIEILDDNDKVVADGEEGNVCVTSLTNRAMPFIRYKIGDRGVKKSNIRCKCGNCSDVLDITAGRINDYALDRNGDKINAYVFVRAIDNLNIMFDGVIKQFQIEQKDVDEFIVRLVLDEDINTEQLEEKFYENLIQTSLVGATFDFEVYDELLPEEKTGKLRYFMNRMKEN